MEGEIEPLRFLVLEIESGDVVGGVIVLDVVVAVVDVSGPLIQEGVCGLWFV